MRVIQKARIRGEKHSPQIYHLTYQTSYFLFLSTYWPYPPVLLEILLVLLRNISQVPPLFSSPLLLLQSRLSCLSPGLPRWLDWVTGLPASFCCFPVISFPHSIQSDLKKKNCSSDHLSTALLKTFQLLLVALEVILCVILVPRPYMIWLFALSSAHFISYHFS